jgi:excisionase family DNA binding protein
MGETLTTAAAARRLGVSESTIRLLERRGLLPAQRTSTGVRIFTAADVARVAEARAQGAERQEPRVP